MRQYIGARYVPRFLGTYSATTVYEALDVVDNGMGTSYIAKIPTPAGTALTDTTHWAIYGATSGAIINLQNQIDALDLTVSGHTTDISTIYGRLGGFGLPRRLIVVTDSYGAGVGGATPFTTPLQTDLALASADYFPFYEGSIGFHTVGVGGHTALTLLQEHEDDVTDPDTITDVVFALGVNDLLATVAQVSADIVTCVAYTKTTYPNATIHIGFISNTAGDRTSSDIVKYVDMVNTYIEGAALNGCHYMTNVEYVMHNARFFISDNVHPTTTAGEEIAKQITSALVTGSADFKIQGSELKNATGYSAGQLVNVDNGSVQFTFSFSVSSALALSGLTYTEVAEFDNPIIKGYSGFPVTFMGYAFCTDNTFKPILCKYYQNKIYASALAYNTTYTLGGVAYWNGTSANTLTC